VTWAAVILAGGAGTRLGGRDKASVEYDGRSLLAHALEAVAGADDVVVVGPPSATPVRARFTRETPAGSGPLAGVHAGIASLGPGFDLVVVLAVDMPGVTSETVARLRDAAATTPGAWLADANGQRQLAGAIRPDLVTRLVADTGPPAGRPMRLLLEAEGTVTVVARGGEADDVDTWEDLTRLWGGPAGDTGNSAAERT
jgi:molybdenum cofactor guanylyltransferase